MEFLISSGSGLLPRIYAKPTGFLLPNSTERPCVFIYLFLLGFLVPPPPWCGEGAEVLIGGNEAVFKV